MRKADPLERDFRIAANLSSLIGNGSTLRFKDVGGGRK
jgi:hypothetical protein